MTRWKIQKHDREQVGKLALALEVAPVIAALLAARGVTTLAAATAFLKPSFDDLHDPFLLRGMSAAVARINQAVAAGERILIWGDYDVDGTTGTVVMRRALQLLGASRVGYHIPHRFTEGYGINQEALEKAKADGYTLVISVDCGIRSFEPLIWARDHGLDVIVTDHHLPDASEGIPPAFCVINPNQPGCEYPDKNLAGVGVAFKLAAALLTEHEQAHLIPGFLKMVAIGTVADVAPLVGENRVIVQLGLRDLPLATNFGLRALMQVAGCTDAATCYDIGFKLAPRINAAGRMDAARTVVELFEAETFARAAELANRLDEYNRERQTVQKRIVELALRELHENNELGERLRVAVIAGEGWHRGVIGIAAAKIAERLHRPTIVISLENGVGHGSARSIAAYHLLEGLDSCAALLEKHGGHRQAAGLTINRKNIGDFRHRINEHAAECLSENDLTEEIAVDAVVSAATLDLELVESLSRLEPFGVGNPRPIFVTKGLRVVGEPFVMKEKHLKYRLSDPASGKTLEAVWWNGVEASHGQTPRPGNGIELAYTPEANTWQGNTRLQLKVADLRTM